MKEKANQRKMNYKTGIGSNAHFKSVEPKEMASPIAIGYSMNGEQ